MYSRYPRHSSSLESVLLTFILQFDNSWIIKLIYLCSLRGLDRWIVSSVNHKCWQMCSGKFSLDFFIYFHFKAIRNCPSTNFHNLSIFIVTFIRLKWSWIKIEYWQWSWLNTRHDKMSRGFLCPASHCHNWRVLSEANWSLIKLYINRDYQNRE